MQLTFDSPDLTCKFGESVGLRLQAGCILGLTGDLGSGKTVFTRGLAIGLGILPDQVSSPTFTLIQIYNNRPPLVHADLYRLENSATEIDRLELQQYFTNDHIVVIEWADRIPHLLPPDHLLFRFSHGDKEHIRNLEIVGTGPTWSDWLTTLAKEWEDTLIKK